MLRSLLLGAASVALVLSGCATSASTASPTAAPAPPSMRRQTVAVFPFTNDGIGGHTRLEFLSGWLADSLAGTLQSSSQLRVVERAELLKILEEQKLGSSELASKEGRLRLGKMAGAQTLVFGNFATVGDVLQITARIVDSESGVILKSVAVHGSVTAARSLGDDLGRKLADNLGITVARAAQASGVAADRSLEEAELFYRALDLEKRGDKDQAIETYRQALAIDPNDREAKDRLRKLLAASR